MKKQILAAALLLCLLLSGCRHSGISQVELAPTPPAETGTVPLEAPAYWYGYWCMENCTGDWKDMEGMWWDMCGQLSREDGTTHLLLWDEDLDKSNYLALMELSPIGEGYRLLGGDFMDLPLSFDEAEISLEEGAMHISGRWYDSSEGAFDYWMCLRPWGELWPETEDRPFYYESWYLPRIEKGELPPDSLYMDICK